MRISDRFVRLARALVALVAVGGIAAQAKAQTRPFEELEPEYRLIGEYDRADIGPIQSDLDKALRDYLLEWKVPESWQVYDASTNTTIYYDLYHPLIDANGNRRFVVVPKNVNNKATWHALNRTSLETKLENGSTWIKITAGARCRMMWMTDGLGHWFWLPIYGGPYGTKAGAETLASDLKISACYRRRRFQGRPSLPKAPLNGDSEFGGISTGPKRRTGANNIPEWAAPWDTYRHGSEADADANRFPNGANSWHGGTQHAVRDPNSPEGWKWVDGIPDTMEQGGRYRFKMKWYNPWSATRVWDPAIGYAMGFAHADRYDKTWSGKNRIPLPEPVPPKDTSESGQKYVVELDFELEPYGVADQAYFGWKMLKDSTDGGWFGEGSASKLVTITKRGWRNAKFDSQIVPTTMQPGNWYWVTVRFQNLGDTTWQPGEVALAPMNSEFVPTWQAGSSGLVKATPKNAIGEFRVLVQAPVRPGETVPFQWKVAEPRETWSGTHYYEYGSPSTLLNVDLKREHATFVSQSVPSLMETGKTYQVGLTFKNTGTISWTKTGGFKLGSQSPQDTTKWGVTRVEMAQSTVAPGETYTFWFNVTPPAASGNHTFQWKMVQENVAWFGDASTPVTVAVRNNQARHVSTTTPAEVQSGQSFYATVVMTNTGDTTWQPGSYMLSSMTGATWGYTTRVAVPNAVAPGQTVTFNLWLIAPTLASGETERAVPFRWQMQESYNGTLLSFGESTPGTRTIRVYAPR